jgi:hypothetical protein
MKKIFTFLLPVVLAFHAWAGPNDGRISITHLGLPTIRVEIDGRSYGNNDRAITINNLAPGNHIIKVYRETALNGKIEAGFSRRPPVFTTNIRIKPKFHVDIVINRFGKPMIDEVFMDTRYTQGGYNDDDYAYDTPDRPGRPDRNGNDDPRYSDNRPQPMNDASFSALLATMKRESFETTRLELTKQVVDKNYFTTTQVRQLLLLYSFDNNRLDLAKHAYKNTIDRENYFQLYELFTFSRSKEELAAYVRDFK